MAPLLERTGRDQKWVLAGALRVASQAESKTEEHNWVFQACRERNGAQAVLTDGTAKLGKGKS